MNNWGAACFLRTRQRAARRFSGEVLLGDLQRSGFEVVSDHGEAEAIIVNTCAFVEDAKNESIEVKDGMEILPIVRKILGISQLSSCENQLAD